MATIRIDLLGKDNASPAIKSTTTSLSTLATKAKTLSVAFQDPALNKDTFSNILMKSATAAGVANNKVLALAGSTGFYTQAQTQNAMAIANATAFAEKLNKQLKSGKISADEAGKQYRQYTDTLATSIPVQQNFLKNLISMGAQIGAIVGIGMAIAKVVTQVYNLAEAGAGLTRLQENFQTLATIGGESSTKLLNSMREASMGAISDADLIATANKAMLLGVTANAEQMATLLQIATIRGRAMGISTTQAFDDMARGIGRASPLILDNLGIIVDARKNYKEYGDMIGVAGNQLNKAQKSQALLTAVVRDGNKLLKESGGISEDTAISYERMEASWANLTNTMKKSAGESLEPVVAWLGRMFDGINRWNNAISAGIEYQKEMAAQGKAFANAWSVYTSVLNNNSVAVSKSAAETEALSDSWVRAKDNAKTFTLSLAEQEELFQAASDRYKGLLDVMTSIGEENRDFANTQGDLNTKMEETKLKLETAIKRYGEKSQKVKDLKADLEELQIEYEENAAAHKAATDKILYDLLLLKLGVDGITAEEYKIAIAAGEAFGIFDEKAANSALVMDELAQAVVDGKLDVDNLKDAMDLIQSKSVSVDVAINVTENRNNATSYSQYIPAKFRAEGGPVTKGQSYWVGEKGRPELFVPEQSGTIVPESKLPSGSKSTTNVFNISGGDPKAIARQIARELKLQGVQTL